MNGAVAIAVLAGVWGAGGPGGGLTVKDFRRVESGRGDAGGLSKSLARGPATVGTPNDFAGVYQIPEDADTPYAGWFARVSGAVIAVFPRGEYVATREGMMPIMPANTKYFMGSVPLSGRAASGASKREGRAVEAENTRVDTNTRTALPDKVITRRADAAVPVTVESAKDPAGVREAMGKLCADPVYRANRVRELLEQAAAQAAR